MVVFKIRSSVRIISALVIAVKVLSEALLRLWSICMRGTYFDDLQKDLWQLIIPILVMHDEKVPKVTPLSSGDVGVRNRVGVRVDSKNADVDVSEDW